MPHKRATIALTTGLDDRPRRPASTTGLADKSEKAKLETKTDEKLEVKLEAKLEARVKAKAVTTVPRSVKSVQITSPPPDLSSALVLPPRAPEAVPSSA